MYLADRQTIGLILRAKLIIAVINIGKLFEQKYMTIMLVPVETFQIKKIPVQPDRSRTIVVNVQWDAIIQQN